MKPKERFPRGLLMSKPMRVCLIGITAFWAIAWVQHHWVKDTDWTNTMFMSVLTAIAWTWIARVIWKA